MRFGTQFSSALVASLFATGAALADEPPVAAPPATESEAAGTFSVPLTVVTDADLRAGPDGLAASLGVVPAGTGVMAAAQSVRSHRRVRLPSGQTGYLSETVLATGSLLSAPLSSTGTALRPPGAKAPLYDGSALLPGAVPFVFRVGVALPGGKDGSAYSSGLVLGGVVGRQIEKHVRLEAGIDRYAVEKTETVSYETMRFTRTQLSIVGIARGTLPVGPLEGSVLAGAGLAFVRLGQAHLATDGSVTYEESQTAPSLVFELGAGLGMRVYRDVRVDAEAVYRRGSATYDSDLKLKLQDLLLSVGAGVAF